MLAITQKKRELKCLAKKMYILLTLLYIYIFIAMTSDEAVILIALHF